MNFLEALKAVQDGKDIRLGDKKFAKNFGELFNLDKQEDCGIRITDMLSNDWQIISEPKMITREQLDAAWNAAFRGNTYPILNDIQIAYQKVCKELGL